ncbi:hypothetical protein [Catellatospora sichuanensis]|uniref:hypothetical protein n=1 Tax=Catellatospora sichuanensis TaxID=1969805 RepID=UPI0011836F0E|nr:hypothetical protein [Catellatospora sichuanensis]
MTTESFETPPADASAEPVAPVATQPAAAPAPRRLSGKLALALAGAFLAGAVCTGCFGVAVVFVGHHADDHREFGGDHPKIERVIPERGEWKGEKGRPGGGMPWEKQAWPGPQDKGIWPDPNGKPGWPGVPAPADKLPSPVPSPSSS